MAALAMQPRLAARETWVEAEAELAESGVLGGYSRHCWLHFLDFDFLVVTRQRLAVGLLFPLSFAPKQFPGDAEEPLLMKAVGCLS